MSKNSRRVPLPTRRSVVLRSAVKPAIAGLAAGALAATILPFTGASAADDKTFQRLSTYAVYKNLPKDVPVSAETVAEISDVSKDGKTLIYTDALGKRIGFLDISNPSKPVGAGSLSLETLGDADDQPTSVAVVGTYVLVVVDTSGGDFANPSGRLDIVRLSDSKRIRSIDLEGQPDSIDVSADEKYAAIAMENQRNEEATPAGGEEGDLPQPPAGFVQVIDLGGAVADWDAHRIDLVNGDGSALPAFVSAGIVAPTDPEPEYVSINAQNKLAVSLQENNGIVIIDLASRAIEKVFTAGTVTVSGIDAKKDGTIALTDSITDVAREPDAIGWVGDDHIATANEGDWKGGSRGWTVFDTQGTVTWDAGNTFERLAISHGLYNDDRAAKKGTEAEGIAISTIDGTRYAFVGSERSNFVAVYDLTNPANPVFEQMLPTTNGPEGILPIPGRNLLAVSSETDVSAVNVRASVGLYQLKDGASTFPSIVSDDVAGAPIGWSALGALTAKPGDPNTLYAAADTVLKPGQIFTVDVSRTPARITSAMTVTEGGTGANLDIEGIFARPQGGFWLASEGATGPANTIYRTDAAGAIQQTVSLPTDVSSHIKNWGLEGVTATTDAAGEHVFVVIQRQLWVDPADQTETVDGDDITRIGRYDVADSSWHWFGYELNSPKRDGADWVGLSEITAVDGDTFAVIERDKLNGPNARNKRIYTVDMPASDPAPGTLPILPKTLAIDVLPALKATHGWTQEKLEGFTIAADGSIYAVTDNDGLKDATGETAFLRLGKATDAFASPLATTTALSVPASAPYGSKPVVTVTVAGGKGITPTGTVVVRDGATEVGRGTLAAGAASIPVRLAGLGNRALVAMYTGDARSVASTSAPVVLRVTKAGSTTRLYSNKTKVKPGKKVTLTLRVSASGFTPTGTVQIKDGNKVVKTVPLVKGVSGLQVTLKKKGTHTLTAVYQGSDWAAGSTSPAVKVKVT